MIKLIGTVVLQFAENLLAKYDNRYLCKVEDRTGEHMNIHGGYARTESEIRTYVCLYNFCTGIQLVHFRNLVNS
jgi:hypothetical protein